jgi:hypothetical protein
MSLPRRHSLGRGRARAPCPRLPTVTALQTATPSRDLLGSLQRAASDRRRSDVRVRNFGGGVLGLHVLTYTNPYLARCGVSLPRLSLSLDLLSVLRPA